LPEKGDGILAARALRVCADEIDERSTQVELSKNTLSPRHFLNGTWRRSREITLIPRRFVVRLLGYQFSLVHDRA